MSEPVDEIMQWFDYAHLTPERQEISKPFCEIANWVVAKLPRSAERTVTLRKLMEAKDAAVRASMVKPVPWGERRSGPDQ